MKLFSEAVHCLRHWHCRLRAGDTLIYFALSPAGERHPQSPTVTAPSVREPLVSANLGHQYALLSEEGVSEADGWCLEHRTAIIYCALCRLRAGTPSVTCGDSSLQLREPRFVLIWRLTQKPSNIKFAVSNNNKQSKKSAVSSCLPQMEGGGSRSETEGVSSHRSAIQ